MAIELGTPTAGGHPSIKLRNVGDYLVGHLVHRAEVPWLEFGTNAPKLGKDGKPRTQERITVLVKSGTAVITNNDEDEQVTPGELVSVYLSGHKRWTWIEAQRAGVGGRLQVGQALKITYDRDSREKNQSGQSYTKKVWEIDIRPAKGDEASTVIECERLYHEVEAAQQAAPQGTDLSGHGDYQNDSIPF